MNLSDFLTEILARRGARADLARAAKVTDGFVTNVIKGRCALSLEYAYKWADALQLTGPKRDYFLALAQAEHVPDVLKDQFRRVATESYEASQVTITAGLRPWVPLDRQEAWAGLSSGSPLAWLRDLVMRRLAHWKESGSSIDEVWAFIEPRRPPPPTASWVTRPTVDACWEGIESAAQLPPSSLIQLLEAIELAPGTLSGAMADRVWRDYYGDYSHPLELVPAYKDDPALAFVHQALDNAQAVTAAAKKESKAARDEAEQLRQDVLALGRQLAHERRRNEEQERIIEQQRRDEGPVVSAG